MPKRKESLSEAMINELRDFVDTNECATDVKRAQAILMLNQNIDEQILIMLTGIDKPYAHKFRKRYEKRGLKGIETKKRKPRSRLTKKQLREIKSMLQNSTPRAYEYDSDFWSTPILADIIKKDYAVEYKSKTSFYLLFKEAKFTYHKPDKQYKNRKQEIIDTWEKETLPIIKDHMQDPDTVVLTEDEMILTTHTTFQKIWLPVGEFPKIDISNTRKRRGIYGFLNAKTGREHAFKTEYLNSEETVKALKEIAKLYLGKKIVIVWDNCSWHKSEEVKEFLLTTIHNFCLINFPPYAPEKNPQEHVWKAGRANTTHNKFIDNIDTATDEFVAYLNNSIFNYAF
jgi:transposase